jgi:enoyl-CoA hydratase/carnithine racemase
VDARPGRGHLEIGPSLSEHELVRYEPSGRVVDIILNRPERLNAINDELTRQLQTAFRRFDDDDSVWVAVLSGAGRAFCSGGDIKDRHRKSHEEMIRDGGPAGRDASLSDIFSKTVNCKPIIAACHGYVMGAGLVLAFDADLVVAEPETVFQMSEVARGIAPAHLWATLAMRGTLGFANDVALTGRRFTAPEAARAGLLTAVSQASQHLAEAHRIAEVIAPNPPLGARNLVRVTRHQMESFERELGALVAPYKFYLTKDFEEAARAFGEGRKPDFKGQ